MNKISTIVLLGILSLCLNGFSLTVDAAQYPTIQVFGNLDKPEDVPTETDVETHTFEEKQTIIKESSLPKTGENRNFKLIILGFIIIMCWMIYFYQQKNKHT